MKPSMKAFEREEQDILDDEDLSEHEKRQAIRDLWREYKELLAEHRARYEDEDE